MSEIQHYLAPGSVAEAVEALSAGDGTILAGGTDLMVQGGSAARLVNIRRIPELGGVSLDGAAIRLGALSTVAEIMADPIIARHLPILAETADQFASPQIRNMATLGGNICNASPAGDMILPLLALGAELELAAKPNGTVKTRRLPLAEFFTGPGATRRQPGELLVAIHVPVPGSGHVGGFRKFGPRPALEIAMAAVAITGELANGVLSNVRVAFGAVAPIPLGGSKTQALLEGKKLNAATIEAAGQAASQEVSPITDARASADYRRHLVRVLSEEILSHVANS